jgi:O-6-methylguanine DNA methyltransferase
VASPLGPVLLASSPAGLVALDFAEARLHLLLQRRFGDFVLKPGGAYAAEVTAYFAGRFGELDAVPLDLGGTPFQREVWSALRRIPLGQTRSYAQLAAELGNPRASRAVGLANALNPISLAIPCHRLVGSSGKLTGYAGGLERKAWLLRHEGAIKRADLARADAADPGAARPWVQDLLTMTAAGTEKSSASWGWGGSKW